MIASRSLWIATSPEIGYPTAPDGLSADVIVVGAGITGLTAALLLQQAGVRTAVLEKGPIVEGETGHTTAHLTELVDTRYSRIERHFGADGARLVAQSSREAIALIEALVREHHIECGFARVPAWLYSEGSADRAWLRDEIAAARRAGLHAVFTRETPLPFRTAGALLLDHQAQFHPRRYLLALAEVFVAHGGLLYQDTRVTGVEDGEPCRVYADEKSFTAREVIVAAHVPVVNWAALITKLPAYRTYAIAIRTRHGLPPGLYWDTDDPYHYTRTQRIDGAEYLILGGEDHKTGTEPDTEACYWRLATWARSRFGTGEPDYRWSGQIIEPVDGLPFIGRNTGSRHVSVASGYSGNGMTWGTIAGSICADLARGRPNRYASLYQATRVKPIAAARKFVAENIDFPRYLVSDRLTNRDVDASDPGAVPPGEGRIVSIDGRKHAIYRADDGTLHSLSPVCPHMHCDVSWNAAERSWDCPCHGSRFSATGQVLNGPAVSEMLPLPLPARRAREHRT